MKYIPVQCVREHPAHVPYIANSVLLSVPRIDQATFVIYVALIIDKFSCA